MRLLLWTTVLFIELCAAQFKGPNDPRRFKYYSTPTPGLGPCDICTGPGGDTIWYQDRKARRVGVLDIKTGKVRDWPIKLTHIVPYFNGRENGTNTCFMRLGQDGFIYGSSPNEGYMMKVTPGGPDMGKTEQIPPKLDIPVQPDWSFLEGWAGPTGIYTSQDTDDSVLFFDYETKKWERLAIRQPASGPIGLRIGQDGALWVTNYLTQTFDRFNLTTNKTQSYLALPSDIRPAIMRTTTNSKFLWANAESDTQGRSGLIRFNSDDPIEFIYIPGGPSYPIQNDRDPFGNIWVSSFADNVLAYYSQSSGKWTTINLPGPPPSPPTPPVRYTLQTIPIHHGPLNSMWFTNIKTNQLGQYVLDDSA